MEQSINDPDVKHTGEKNILFSRTATFALLLLFAFVLAAATIFEKYFGTQAAKVFFYYSPALFLLQLLLVVNFVAVSVKQRLFRKRKPGFIVTHLALVIILAGALVTHLFGIEGTIHLRESETSNRMQIQTDKAHTYQKLPFTLQLTDFTLTRYPGSSSPSSFESTLSIQEENNRYEKKISMNNVLDIQGYRLFQASYDKDEKGTILSVSKDVAGRNITYTGYLLLITGFILSFTGKNSRFRQLNNRLKDIKAASKIAGCLFFLLLCTLPANAHVDPQRAAEYGAIPMLARDGRVKPVNTFSSELLRKLSRSTTIDHLNSDQFLLGLLTEPQKWMHTPLIALSNKDIALQYDLTPKKCAYVELFDSNGNYKPQKELDEIVAKPPSARTRYDKDLIKLDEQIGILHQLFNGGMSNILPDPHNSVFVSRLPETEVNTQRIKAELFYNKLDIFRLCKIYYLVTGGLLLVFSFVSLFKKRSLPIRGARYLPVIAVSVGLLCHLIGIGLRWYISGHAPWSNSYETMVFLSFATVAAGVLFSQKSILVLAPAVLFGGVILFVAGLGWMDPQITPLVPVLKSPWLMLHVSVIMAAYGFFGISFLLGTVNLFAPRMRELSIINEMSVLAGLALMTIGTFLGAVWANESWGRYWGWDPKETWALITILVYAATAHLPMLQKQKTPLLFNLMTVLAFACVLMTYFGVNYLLGGMHSYGK